MRNLSPYIYEIALKLCGIIDERESAKILKIYEGVFIERFSALIISHSQSFNPTEYQADDFSGVVEKRLSNIERELYNLHRRQNVSSHKWKNH